MSLGLTNITISDVKTEIGSSSNSVSALVGAPGLNKYSFYAPGSLAVDASKNVTLTPPTSNYKLGDFRSYNDSALTPSAQVDYTQNWGPSAADFDFAVSWFPQNMNIKAFVEPADYVTMDFYPTSLDRTNETNLIKRQCASILYDDIIPLAGHTRQVTKQAYSTQAPVWVYSYPTGGLSDPDTSIYMETYISDLTSVKKINLGIRNNNYTTIKFHKNQIPYIYGGGNVPYHPSGWTSVFPEVSISSTPVCSFAPQLDMTFGSSTIDFYIVARGIYGLQQKIIDVTDCSVMLTIDGSTQKLYSGPISYSAGTHIDTTLSISGGTWAYDDIGAITLVDCEFNDNASTNCT
jgi:hypothetical protein